MTPLSQSLRTILLCSRLLSSSTTSPRSVGPRMKGSTVSEGAGEQHIPAAPRPRRWKDSMVSKGAEDDLSEQDATTRPRRGNFWKLKQERYRKHISDLVRKSRQSEAVKLLEQMKKGRVRPDEVTYNTILSGYAKQGDVTMAFKTFNEMKKRGLHPTDHTYSSLFAACGAAGVKGADILDKVRAEMERRDVHPNTIVTNSLISALALCGKHEEAMQVYLDMSKLNSEPDLCTFGGLLLALSKDRGGGLHVAKRVWSEMRASGLKADLYSYNMALQVLRDGGVVSDEKGVCLNVYGEPLKRVIPPVSMDILQRKHGEENVRKDRAQLKNSDKSATVETSQDMAEREKERKSKDQLDKSTAVETSQDMAGEECVSRDTPVLEEVGDVASGSTPGKQGEVKVEATENWLRKSVADQSVFYVRDKVEFSFSEAHHVVLHVGSLTPTGPGVARWLEKSSIEAFFAALKQSGVKPNIHTFQLLVHLTLDPAHLLVTMRERKVGVDNKFMVAAITQQARQLRNLQGAKVLFEYCRGIGLDLGQVGYQALASGCNHYKDGMALLDKMEEDGVPPNHHVLGTLIGHAVRDHNYVYLTALVKLMMNMDYKPSPTIITMLDTAAARQPKANSPQYKRLHGFRGFYMIWKRKVQPPSPQTQDKVVLAQDKL